MVIVLDINIVLILVVMFAIRQSDNVQRASVVENDETENEGHYVQKA